MPDPLMPRDPLNPLVPPISARDEPRFRSAERKDALAAAFQDQGDDYDRLRPGYPAAVLDAILAHLPGEGIGPSVTSASARAGASAGASARLSGAGASPQPHEALHAIDLGAGTGKLSWALAGRGLDVTAVDTSRAMLETALRRNPSAASAPALTTHVAPAEDTCLPAASAELVTVAQAWHWFDAQTASAEVTRLLAPGGVLALVWNMLDVTIPWVHRLSRIMHAGDIHREDFTPTIGPGFTLLERGVHQWADPMPTQSVIDLARTRSYFITAPAERRATVLANLDWYLHDHLGHAPGSSLGIPYRTDLFIYRPMKQPAPH